MSYFCYECKRKHFRGKIYEEHKKYSKKPTKIVKMLSLIKITEKKFNSLPDIAIRQIANLMRKRKLTKRFNLYNSEINKVILLNE